MRFRLTVGALSLLAVPAIAQTPRTQVQVDTTTPNLSAARGVATDSSDDLAAIIYFYDNLYHVVTSTDGGNTWGAPVRIDDDPSAIGKFGGFQNCMMPVHVSGTNIYAMWEDDRDGSIDCYFTRSTDSGATWEADIRLDDTFSIGDTPLRDPAMAVGRDAGDDYIYVLMSVEPGTGGANLDEQLFLVVSDDSGSSFNAAIDASTENGTADVDGVAVAADGDTVHIVFTDNRAGGGNDVFYRRSSDGGQFWDFDEIQIDSSGPAVGAASFPCIALSGNIVAVSWNESFGGRDEARVAVSTDGGDTWGAATRPGNYTPSVHDVDFLEVEISGNNIVASWNDNRFDSDPAGGFDENDIFAATSTNFGVSWNTDVQLSDGGALGVHNFPAMEADDDGDVLVVYWDGLEPSCDGEAFAAVSGDNGLTWETAVQVSDNPNPLMPQDLDFIVGSYDDESGNVVMAWQLNGQETGTCGNDSGVNKIWTGGFNACAKSSITFRNGGTNPTSYTASGAVLGGPFSLNIDLTTTGHNLGTILGYLGASTFTLGGGQTVLMDLGHPAGDILQLPVFPGPMVNIAGTVPNDPAICGLFVATQAVHIGGVRPFALSNAQDFIPGDF